MLSPSLETSPTTMPKLAPAIRPIPRPLARTVARARGAIRDILHGRDRRRALAVVGPCSIHDPAEALEYARRLAEVAAETQDALVVVMRTYVEKPRSGLGWKGLLNDPDLDGSCDVARGIELARELLADINGLGLACASELLDVVAARYLVDLLGWAAIGARTSASQPHRELASGLELPIGFKNGVEGDLGSAAGALEAAREPHACLGVDSAGLAAVIRTSGNPDAHIVLRGGSAGPNYDPASVARASEVGRRHRLSRPVVIDCSHGNSGKDHRRQGGVFREVIGRLEAGQDAIAGLMLESQLLPGRQALLPGARPEPGISVTDACIGWAETEELLHEAAEALRARSRRRSRLR